MARRTVSEIYAALVEEKNNQPNLSTLQPTSDDEQTLLSDLNTPSRVADWRLWLFIVAVGIYLHEGVLELLRGEMEILVASAAPATPQWVQKKVFEFQYDAGDPQIAQLIDFNVKYPFIDEALRIITRCSVKTAPNRTIAIKVAKGTTPTQLAAPEISALASYAELLLPAGVRASIISGNSDRLYLNAQIFYDGQYSGSIQQDVIDALDAYLADFSRVNFDGTLRRSGVIDAIQAVPGVIDVLVNDMKARAETVAFVNATAVPLQWQSVMGHIIQEDTAGQTFTDTLTFNAQ